MLARTSGWDWTKKSRFRSNAFSFVRRPATRPSGFVVGMTTTIAWSRSSSTAAFVPCGQRHEVADHLHHRVGALALAAVDVRLDEDRELDVLAPGREQALRRGRIGQHEPAKLLPAGVVALLLRSLQGVDHDAEHVSAELGLPDDRVAQPIGDAGRGGLVLEPVEGAADRPVRDEGERRGLRDVLASHRGAPLLAVGRTEPGGNGVPVIRRGRLRAGRGREPDRREDQPDRDRGGQPAECLLRSLHGTPSSPDPLPDPGI